MIVKERWLSCL